MTLSISALLRLSLIAPFASAFADPSDYEFQVEMNTAIGIAPGPSDVGDDTWRSAVALSHGSARAHRMNGARKETGRYVHRLVRCSARSAIVSIAIDEPFA